MCFQSIADIQQVQQIKLMRSLVAVAVILSSQAASAGTTYFPPAFSRSTINCSFGGPSNPVPLLSDLERKWFSTQLAAAQEPSLYATSAQRRVGANTTLRFTWLRSFHPPVVVRIEGLGSATPRLVAKQLSGAGGYAPGGISKHVERPLSHQEQKLIRTALEKANVRSVPPKVCEFGLDGAEWIVEAVDASGYHFVDRWSPQSGEVRDLGMALLTVTGWDFKPIY